MEAMTDRCQEPPVEPSVLCSKTAGKKEEVSYSSDLESLNLFVRGQTEPGEPVQDGADGEGAAADIYQLAAPRRKSELTGELLSAEMVRKNAAIFQVARMAKEHHKELERRRHSALPLMSRSKTGPASSLRANRDAAAGAATSSSAAAAAAVAAAAAAAAQVDDMESMDGVSSRGSAFLGGTVSVPVEQHSLHGHGVETHHIASDTSEVAEVASDAGLESSVSSLPSTSLGDASASLGWEGADNTVVIFDWDDTLFPTAFMRFEVRPKLPESMRNSPPPEGSAEHIALQKHAELLHDLLACASSIGQVSIVTLSTRPWVLTSAETYMPSLDLPGLLEDLGITVHYAFEHITKGHRMRAEEEEGIDVLSECKQSAMKKILRKSYQGKSVRPHVISIGDSLAEQTALKEVMWSWSTLVGLEIPAPPLCKTVKFMDEPSIGQLSAEIELLTAWLPRMAAFPKDFDFSMDDEEGLQGSAHKLGDG